MAMPKKGVRKITVNGEVYRYVIKHSRTDYGAVPVELAKVTIESPDKTQYYIDRTEKAKITPSYVRGLIEKHF